VLPDRGCAASHFPTPQVPRRQAAACADVGKHREPSILGSSGQFEVLGTVGRDRDRARIVKLDSYRSLEAIAVRAGDASESAIVAQLVPAAEIH
jgi:hypothetical protein